MPICQSRSTAGAGWKSICCVRIRASRLKWTERCIWQIQSPTAGDRRKDQLLQESGYLVLRFLAEDLAKDLDTVLDRILRSLSSRRKPSVTYPLTVVRGSRV